MRKPRRTVAKIRLDMKSVRAKISRIHKRIDILVADSRGYNTRLAELDSELRETQTYNKTHGKKGTVH